MEAFNRINQLLIKHTKSNINDVIDIIIVWKYLFNNIYSELILSKPHFHSPKQNITIMLTMTTCKRLHLFVKTINSILNTWNDIALIDYFFIVDDNSIDSDKKYMMDNYPWMDFYMKPISEKGHKESMNIIWNKLYAINPKYWIHIEDDFLFFDKMDYIATAIDGLNKLEIYNVKQILFNKNYAETIDDYKLTHGLIYDDTFLIHHYQKNGYGTTYWPYYSLRPSLTDVDTILSLGNYDTSDTFFEMTYALKYLNKGYKSAFFNKITNIHIGKLTSDKTSDNAYTLNNVSQFITDNKIKVINLKRRSDRKDYIIHLFAQHNIKYYDFVDAVDGRDLYLTDKIEKIFVGNDFNYRRSVIGCALSHILIWEDLVKSNNKYVIIMEDDVKLIENFTETMAYITNNVINFAEHELVFFGYHQKFNHNTCLDRVDPKAITIMDIDKDNYIGGTHCYLITKSGAQKILTYINDNGIKHGIDYYMVMAQTVIVPYSLNKHIAHADWVNSYNAIVDSDIQYDRNSISFELTDYIFLNQLDQIGFDCHMSNGIRNIIDLKNIANSLPNCIGFNTLGYFKYKIENLEKSKYFTDNDGIFIKKEYYDKYLKKKELE